MAYISPYKDFSHLRSGTLEKEKHACGVIHELLSLTTEKRTLVDHFREEFRFSQQLRGMIIRHPDLFYVSLRGERDSVFLREAYRNSELIDKDPLTLVKEKMRALVTVPRYPRRGGVKKDEIGGSDVEGEEEEESDDEEWSDVDGDWTDDDEGEEDVPPNFDDEEEEEDSVKIPSSRKPRKKEEKLLTPVFPDGTPREKW